ncbi:MAG: hypothetical protein AAF573_18330 [Bacteroidota bacterium]
MEKYLAHIFIPMIISNVLHMLIVKKDVLASLARSISIVLFGKNKTWRGMVVVPIINGIFFLIVNIIYPVFKCGQAFLVGCLLGLAYVISELPNSFFKRRRGIAAGQQAKKHTWLFMLLDKSDSALGVSLVSKFLLELTWTETLQLFFTAMGVHIFFSWLLVQIKVKERF